MASQQKPIALEGTLDKVVFHNDSTDFTIARFKLTEGAEFVSVLGNLTGVRTGESLKVRGHWETHKKFGRQFRITGYQSVTPATVAGIKNYLASGLIPGIGAELAERITAVFGHKTLDVIENDPGRLVEVDGIGRVRAQRIKEGVVEHKALQDIMVFLQGHGVSPAFAARIYKRYGNETIAKVRENPYRLALDVWGVGFKTADAIARSLGIEKTSPSRAEAGILHVLGEFTDAGHVHAPEHALLASAEQMLEVGADIISPAIDRLIASERLVREDLGDRGDCLSLRAMWEAETSVAENLVRIAKAPLPKLAKDKSATRLESRIELAPQQREAIELAIHDKVMVVTGGPGVGKTTIVNEIIARLAFDGLVICLAAPTGRAAKRMAEATGRPAKTLHRLLEFQPRTSTFDRNEDNPLDADMVIVDEASMMDINLMSALCAAIPSASRLVLVGDVDQLPSVGPGRVLADVISSRVVNVAKLTEIFRQAAESSIVLNAHEINRGEMPDLSRKEDSDFYFVERDEPEEVLSTILDLVGTRIPRRFGLDAIGQVQVISPMHRGPVGTQNLNLQLQARLNPPEITKAELKRNARTFRVGDKVMQLRNDYDKDVFNGDIGRVSGIVKSDEATQLIVEMDGRSLVYEENELDRLDHAFALTVHKSQGSEYPAVVLPLVTQHFMLLQRNLLYTAITRGKQLVMLVGSRKALAIAIRNNDTKLRWTWLEKRLQEKS